MRWLALIVAVLALEATAVAAPCSREAVADELVALGGPPLDDIGDRVRIEITGLAGSITYELASGELIGPRVVRAASCRELAKSLALVIVMSLRADEPRDEPAAPVPVEPSQPAGVAAHAKPRSSTPSQASPGGATTRRPSLAAPQASTGGATTSPPSLAASRASPGGATPPHLEALLGAAGDASRRPALVLGARWRQGRISLGVELAIRNPITIDVEAGGSVEVTQTGIEAVPCFHIRALALCGLASAGMIGGEGHQLAEAAHARRAAVAFGGRVELVVPILDRVALRLHLDGLQALDRTQFLVDEMAVWTSDSRELWLGAGVLANFL